MGKEISKLSQKICIKSNYYKILLLGLEGTGKTTLFDRIKSNEVYIRNPTIGFNAEQIKLEGHNVTLWDFGGHEKIMSLWHRYFLNTDLVILVIDSSDSDSFDKLKNILNMIRDNIPDVYVMVVINKIDLKEAMSTEKIESMIDLYNYGLKIANVIRTSMVRGDGVKEVIKYISKILRNV